MPQNSVVKREFSPPGSHMQHDVSGGNSYRHFHLNIKIECAPFHDGTARFAFLAHLMR